MCTEKLKVQRPTKHIIGHIGYRPKQQCQSIEGRQKRKDWLQSHQVHATVLQNITHMIRKNTKFTDINANEFRNSETKPNPENCKNCSSKCAYDCAQLQYTIQHRTVLIFSLISRQP